jgi:hypothetical protein
MIQRFLHISLDFVGNRVTIKISPPIQFRIEWAVSQGMSPRLGCRPIFLLLLVVGCSKRNQTRALSLVSNSPVKSIRFALFLPLLHLGILAAPMFHEERQVWSFIPLLQAWHDGQWAHPEFASAGMPVSPCYEYRFSNAARLIFTVNLPTAVLIGSPRGCRKVPSR